MTAVVRTVGTATVRGKVEANGAAAYLGIRYATADRFSKPKAIPLAAMVDATVFGAACPQVPVYAPMVPGGALRVAESEDCLSLNVWTPAGEGPFPVMVWIHGGSFLTGASSQAMYDGSALAARGLVVVSVNYRIGPLGFLDLRSLEGASTRCTPNAGLHDQVAALRWVRQHIAAFGGDQASVTVVGESAGGGSILHLLSAAQRPEWFDRAIVFSGSAGFTFQPEVAGRIAQRFAVASEVSVSALATTNVDRLIAAVGATMADPEVFAAAGMMPFHPSIDGELVLEAPLAGLQRGAANDCGLWLSTTRDEMALFVEGSTMEVERLVKRVSRYVGVDMEVAQRLVEAYERLLRREGRSAAAIDIWVAMYSDREMTLPIRALLDASTAQSGRDEPVYGSLFSWESPQRQDGRPVGAAHATDLPFIFNTFSIDGWNEFVGATRGRVQAANRLTDSLQSAIVKFCGSGDPGWPQWSQQRSMFVFDEECRMVFDPLAGRRDLWDRIGV